MQLPLSKQPRLSPRNKPCHPKPPSSCNLNNDERPIILTSGGLQTIILKIYKGYQKEKGKLSPNRGMQGQEKSMF